MTRTDIHSPSSIIPADYTFLFGYAHLSSVDGWPVPGYNLDLLVATRKGEAFNGTDPIYRHGGGTLSRTVIKFAAIHKNGACDVCGAHHIEGSVFFHVPTAEAIALGWQCAEKLELDFDESERALIAGNRKQARATAAAKARRFAFLRSFVRQERLESRGPDFLRALQVDHYITKDIRTRLIRKGYEPSEKQRTFVIKLALDIQERGNKPEEQHVRAPVEDKRQRVEGLIVGVKVFDSYNYGSILKITVKVETPDGSWLTWGTAPSALLSLVQDVGGLRGATVAFDAKLKRTNDSEHFTFFSRPTKPELLAVSSDEARATLIRIQEGLDLDSAEPEVDFSGTPAHREWREREEAQRDKLTALLGD